MQLKKNKTKKQKTKTEFHSPASVENRYIYEVAKRKKSSAEKILEPSFNDNSKEHSVQSIYEEKNLLSKSIVHFKLSP